MFRKVCLSWMGGGIVGFLFAVSCMAGEVVVPGERKAESAIPIPDAGRMRELAISRWPSSVSRATRVELFRQIEILTEEHMRLLSSTSTCVEEEPDVGLWMERKFPASSRFYKQDRALAAGVLMQIDLLDEVLAVRDPARADAVRAARRLRSVRSEEDRIFFDKRDEVFNYCIDTLNDLQTLQLALAGIELPPSPCNIEVRKWCDVERYLVCRLQQLALCAKEIP